MSMPTNPTDEYDAYVGATVGSEQDWLKAFAEAGVAVHFSIWRVTIAETNERFPYALCDQVTKRNPDPTKVCITGSGLIEQVSCQDCQRMLDELEKVAESMGVGGQDDADQG